MRDRSRLVDLRSQTERYWLVSVGPFDEDHVVEWVDKLRDRSSGSPDVDLIDHRRWYARAFDDVTVRDALVVLRAGMDSPEVTDDIRWCVTGLIDGMETWLEREYEPGPE